MTFRCCSGCWSRRKKYASKKKVEEEFINVVDNSPDVKKKKPAPSPKKLKQQTNPTPKTLLKKKSARATVKKVTPCCVYSQERAY